MAIPTYATALSQINTFIVANGNNEITANVLNPVLKVILDFSNNNIGDLNTLTTDEKNTIVDSINSLKQQFENLNNSGVQLYTGTNDPNITPPPSYNYADFFMQLDSEDNSPIQLWQWNGFEWRDSSSYPATDSDNVDNNSDVPGVTVTDALNNLQTDITEVGSLIPTAYTNNVYVNNDDPNSATIFSLDNPPVVNDDSLKNSSSNLYIGLNSSLWVYNGTNYSTKPETSTSNFNFANTPNDAGGNKNLPISRTGSVQAPAFIKTGGLSTEFLKADGSIDNTNYGSTSDYSLYASQQEKYKFYEPEGISENPPILSAPVQNGTSTLPDFVFKSTVSGTALSSYFSYFTGEMKRADYSKATDTYSGTFPDYNYVKNIAVTTTNSFGNVAVEFTFDGLAIELVEKGQNARIQILVDEGDGYKRLTHLTQGAAPANGSRYLRKMTFPDRRFRKIKVEYSGGYFGGVYVSNGDIVAPVVRRVGKKAIFFGNSFTEGTGGDGAFNGYAAVTGDLLGVEAWMSGSGGTGYINSGPAGRVKFQDRVSRDVVYYTPDIVVIEGGNNDTTQDQTALSTAVNLLISTIKTALPSATIYVLSNFQLQGSTTNIVNTRNTIKAAALANSVFFIDVIDGVSYTAAGVAITQPSGSWITGGGSITDIKLYGNASMYVAADKAHPSIDGHRYIGNRLALEMSRLSGSDFFNTAGTTTPEFPAYATLASPALTGVPTAPTALPGTNTTQIATMEALQTAVSGASSDIQDIVDAATKTATIDAGNSQISLFDGTTDNRNFSVIINNGSAQTSTLTLNNSYAQLIGEYDGDIAAFRTELGKATIAQNISGGTASLRIDPDLTHGSYHFSVAKTYNDATTSAKTGTELDTDYPIARTGDKVHALSITGGGKIYEKSASGWVEYNVTNLAP